MKTMTRRTAAIGLVLAAASPSTLFAQTPAPSSKPLTLIVPFTAGSGTDVIARIVSEQLSKTLGQTVVVDNRPGAGGTVGASQVAAAPADGSTVLVHSAGHVANPALYPKLKYDTLKDFTPVAMLAVLPNVLVVSPDSKVASVAELVKRATGEPGKLSYASAGNGSATHINAEKFRIATNVSAAHIPYRGTPPALTDVVGGQVDWFFAPLVSALPLIQDRKLVPLAVGTHQRSSVLPQVPTIAEAGYPSAEYAFWVGMFVPAKTPAETVARLVAATDKALQLPEVKAAMEKLGAEPARLSRQQFAEQVEREVSATAALVSQAGIKVD